MAWGKTWKMSQFPQRIFSLLLKYMWNEVALFSMNWAYSWRWQWRSSSHFRAGNIDQYKISRITNLCISIWSRIMPQKTINITKNLFWKQFICNEIERNKCEEKSLIGCSAICTCDRLSSSVWDLNNNSSFDWGSWVSLAIMRS